MAALDGFVRLPGSQRRYVTPTGAEISRRQYQRIERLQRLGESVSNERYAMKRRQEMRRNHMSRYTSMLRDYSRSHEVPKGVARTSEDFREIYRVLKTSDDNSPDGEKAKALERIGRRQPDWAWPVGDTNIQLATGRAA